MISFTTHRTRAIHLSGNTYGEPNAPEVIVPGSASLTLALFGMLLNTSPFEFVGAGRTLESLARQSGLLSGSRVPVPRQC
jgi:hypothetical protein